MENEGQTGQTGRAKLFFAGTLLGTIGGIVGASYFSLSQTDSLVVILTAAIALGILTFNLGGGVWEFLIDLTSDD